LARGATEVAKYNVEREMGLVKKTIFGTKIRMYHVLAVDVLKPFSRVSAPFLSR
jgi:hypothetical protein